MKTGIELIAEERREQIEKHGRTIESDLKTNSNGELIMVARAMLIEDEEFPEGFGKNIRRAEMPADWDDAVCQRMAGKSRKERIIIAGALIAAELDVIQAEES